MACCYALLGRSIYTSFTLLGLFQSFVSSFMYWEGLGVMPYCFHVELVPGVVRSCRQVRVLLIVCPSHALFVI